MQWSFPVESDNFFEGSKIPQKHVIVVEGIESNAFFLVSLLQNAISPAVLCWLLELCCKWTRVHSTLRMGPWQTKCSFRTFPNLMVSSTSCIFLVVYLLLNHHWGEQVALVLHTSGTTKKPKIVPLTWGSQREPSGWWMVGRIFCGDGPSNLM